MLSGTRSADGGVDPIEGSTATNPPRQCWQYTRLPNSVTRIRSVRPQTGQP